MRLLDDSQLNEWLTERSFAMAAGKIYLPINTQEYIVIEVPERSDDQMLLCGELLSLGGYEEKHTDMIWISNWTIWNDWNRDLGQEIVCRLRGANSECLGAASAHVLPFRDRKVAVAILWQILLFHWDGWLIPTERTLVQCSHDGLIWITCRDHEAQTELLEVLATWKPIVRPFL
jgi:hypothetical protein